MHMFVYLGALAVAFAWQDCRHMNPCLFFSLSLSLSYLQYLGARKMKACAKAL